jgi:hypothetical protein
MKRLMNKGMDDFRAEVQRRKSEGDHVFGLRPFQKMADHHQWLWVSIKEKIQELLFRPGN